MIIALNGLPKLHTVFDAARRLEGNYHSTCTQLTVKAGVYMNRSEILSIIKRELLGLK